MALASSQTPNQPVRVGASGPHSPHPCFCPPPNPHTHRDIVVYLDKKDGKPLGSGNVDAAAVARWTDKIHAWDGNLFVAANSSPGGWVVWWRALH